MDIKMICFPTVRMMDVEKGEVQETDSKKRNGKNVRRVGELKEKAANSQTKQGKPSKLSCPYF